MKKEQETKKERISNDFLSKCKSTAKWYDEPTSYVRAYENRIERKGCLMGSRI